MKHVDLTNEAEAREHLACAAEKIIAGDRDVREATAVDVVKTLQDMIEQDNIGEQLLTRENFALNETPKYTLDEELFAYVHAPGSYAPMTQPRNRELTFGFEMISCHIYLPLQQLRSGRYGGVNEQLNKAQRAILGKTNKIVLDTMKAAVPSTSGFGNYLASSNTAIDRGELNAAINYVEDQVGGARLIAGRRDKTYGILDFNTNSSAQYTGVYPEDVQRTIQQTGALGMYRGLPVTGWKQYKTRDGVKTLDEQSVWVVGNDVGVIGYQEEFQSLDDIDVPTLNWHIHAWVMVGVMIAFPERIYRLVLS